MISGMWSRLTAPTTHYTRGQIQGPDQARAAQNVARLESMVDSLEKAMSSIDESQADLNQGVGGSVYGRVNARDFQGGTRGFSGFCKLENGEASELRVTSDDSRLTLTTRGERREIHYVHKFEGSGSTYDSGPSVLETHEWALFDGNKVQHRSYSFFSDDPSL